MEKRTPHCKLVVVKNLLAAGKVRATVSALAGGAALVAAKVPCSVINDYDVLFDDPHVKYRGIEIEMAHPITPTTKVRMVANPIRLSESPVRYDRPPPMIGQHTDEVLGELGFDAARMATLRDQGVI